MLGLSLLYVGAVLVLNGLWLLGKIEDREIWVIDVFSGVVTLLVSMKLAFGAQADAASIKSAALTLLFTFTYFWVAINRYNGANGCGLGWFSLFVAITVVPVGIDSVAHAASPGALWIALCWFAWAILWLMFFVLLALRRPIAKLTGVVAILAGILTGWLPGYLLLNGTLN